MGFGAFISPCGTLGAGGENFGGGGAANLGRAGADFCDPLAKGASAGVEPAIPPEMIRVYSLGPAGIGGGLEAGRPGAEKRWVAPSGNDGSASRSVLLTVGFGRIGSTEAITGGLAGGGAGAVHIGSLDAGGISFFGATGSQVRAGALVRDGAGGLASGNNCVNAPAS